MTEVKSATTVSEQIGLLRSRGMRLDEEFARQWLTNVSYYRLSGYWYPARRTGRDGSVEDTFTSGSDFADVVALYEADRKLRTLIHDGIERVEVALRTRLIDVLSAGGPLGYQDPCWFRESFDHSRWLEIAEKRLGRAKRHSAPVKHYSENYGGEFPIWVLAEVLDFADISRLFEGLKKDHQLEVAESLGVRIDLGSLSRNQRRKAAVQSPLVRWMEQLTVIRNVCAHHGRLWNKSFVPAPSTAMRTVHSLRRIPENQSERLYGALIVMAHLLRVVSPGTSWPRKVSRLIASDFGDNPMVRIHSMGIPHEWDARL